MDMRQKAILAIACLCAGIAPLAARAIPDDVSRVAYGVVVAAAYLAFALFAKKQASLHQFWQLSFAFFVFALVQVLNSSIPGFVGTSVLHDPPNAGNPLASTVSGTVVIQLLETLIAIVPVVVLTKLAGDDLRTIYARPGVVGGWLMFAVVFFVLFYFVVANIPVRFLPANGAVTPDRFRALTPALLVVALSNGFEEEFLFRGLFLQKYNFFLNARVANVLQAVVFSAAHAGVTYTPSAVLFILVVVFPLGLAAGYLMRASNGVLVPGIFHGGLDMAIYLGFLSAAA